MNERKAIYYGQVELIPGVMCDGYVLDDGTAVMSERGTAALLGMKHSSLQNMAVNWPPKSLEPFIGKDLSMAVNFVEVIAPNSHYKGRKIAVYTTAMVENLICGYALAFANGCLRENQSHIGKMAVTSMRALVGTALETAVKEACGFIPEIQKTAQKHYVDAVGLIRELGFSCSIDNRLATKKDITAFLKIPEGTLNNFLRKYREEFNPIRLDSATIRSIGSKARYLKGYSLDDVAKIAFGMDTQVGIELKKRMFGQVGAFVKLHSREEIQWREVLSKIFEGFGLYYNYPVGKYRVDYFVDKIGLCLECNGYDCHRYYAPKEEEKREKAITQKYALVRFHHKVSLETLFNGILQAKIGAVIRLYDLKNLAK